MSTTELRKHLIELINKTDDENILNEINRLLEIEAEAKAIYELNAQQIDAINEARSLYKKGQTLDNDQANKMFENKNYCWSELSQSQKTEVLVG